MGAGLESATGSAWLVLLSIVIGVSLLLVLIGIIAALTIPNNTQTIEPMLSNNSNIASTNPDVSSNNFNSANSPNSYNSTHIVSNTANIPADDRIQINMRTGLPIQIPPDGSLGYSVEYRTNHNWNTGAIHYYSPNGSGEAVIDLNGGWLIYQADHWVKMPSITIYSPSQNIHVIGYRRGQLLKDGQPIYIVQYLNEYQQAAEMRLVAGL